MTKTIARNATRKIAGIKAKRLTCRAYGLHNNFIAQECDPEYAWKQLFTYDFARLIAHDNGDYTIHVHNNCWYKLTETA